MIKPEKSPWVTQLSQVEYENKWIRVEEHQVINPAGRPGIYGKVHFKNKAIGIVPIDDTGHTWLVGQWRYPLGEWSWEIPEGGGPEGSDVLDSAKRELKEETGLVARTWTMIQRIHLSNSVSDEEGFIFLAEDLTQGDVQPEETEADMTIWRLPLIEAIQMALDGKITDSLSVVGLLRVGRTRGAG